MCKEHLTQADVEFLEKHSIEEIEVMEALEKGGSCKCVRCGKPVSSKGGRCAACLKKLRAAKHTPGSAQRAQTKADDALRRNAGKNGTAHKKSKNLGSRASIIRQVKTAEKKTGQKLSPDRRKNSEGYGASNVRMVPERLNRGRHHVDPKKLAAWHKKLKKSGLTIEELFTLVLAKAIEEQDQLMVEALSKAMTNF